MASKMDEVQAALVALWSALPALAGVPVYDGPPVSQAADLDQVLVGNDGDVDSDTMSDFSQEWVDLAQTRRVESGEIICAVVAQSGSTDLGVQRDRAFVLLAACEDSLRADQTLGGTVFSALLTSGSAHPLQNSAGSAMIAPFTVQYRVHI